MAKWCCMTSIATSQEAYRFYLSLWDMRSGGNQPSYKKCSSSEYGLLCWSLTSHAERSSGEREVTHHPSAAYALPAEMPNKSGKKIFWTFSQIQPSHDSSISYHILQLHGGLPPPKWSYWAKPIRPTEPWEIIHCCIKPLNFGMVCYASIDECNRIKGCKVNIPHKHQLKETCVNYVNSKVDKM